MQPLPFIFNQRIIFVNPQARQHTSASGPQVNFYKQTFANQGNQESRHEFTARRSLHAGTDPNEVRWKNLLRHLRIPQPAGTCFELCPAFHMLELAKGFEPPTP
jgi:hypothetical protein